MVEYNNRRFHGMGLATDIVGSSANAMIHVLNCIWRSEQVEKEKIKYIKIHNQTQRKQNNYVEQLSYRRIAR